MAAEDPASVLEQFIHDVANLPAEITHLYEEMQAKEQQIQDCRAIIQARDSSLQKFIKLNGPIVQNPKEEPYSKIILQNYERAQVLQEEKIGLSEKAAALLDRHVKRLDIKLRDLQNDGSIPSDPQMPSLLRESPGNLVPPLSLANTGANTPLNPLSGNTSGGGANIAHAAIAHITNAASATSGRLNPSSLQNMQATALLNQQRLTNAQQAIQANARQEREMSVGSESKRRRLNASLGSLPPPTSQLGRSSSTGPGTPKPSTPGSRAGSVGPNKPPKKALTVKKANPHQPLRKQLTSKTLKSKRNRPKNGSRASPSTTADDESASGSDDEEMTGMAGDAQEEDESDDTKYCFCQRVSFGDMVACDNENCQFQWFHWECVGIKEEPVGDWLCPDCRKLPPNKIKRAR
ncbi:hypothetical protein GQ43DRAFT_476444 [Delitschia confertaspora ATCC 74209]|uniref:Chromatin modification-related protein n=1 Tax=Delitschia confertaspora ATCC 74209 TaxID=1513339 RepID=A0A9P4MMP0_9PLEO|nr:hypothetical protein GQ43DRAFT_476444 [Delitschia confertaspora ATCC 74209]